MGNLRQLAVLLALCGYNLTAMPSWVKALCPPALEYFSFSAAATERLVQQALDPQDLAVTVELIHQIERRGKSTALVVARQYLQSPDLSRRLIGIELFIRNGSQTDFVNEIPPLLSDAEPSVRLRVLNEMGRTLTPVPLDKLDEMAISDTEPTVRQAARNLADRFSLDKNRRRLAERTPPLWDDYRWFKYQGGTLTDAELLELAPRVGTAYSNRWEEEFKVRLSEIGYLSGETNERLAALASDIDHPLVAYTALTRLVQRPDSVDQLVRLRPHYQFKTEWRQRLDAATSWWSSDPRFSPLYRNLRTFKTWENFATSETIGFERFEKTGITYLLGGPAAGKLIIRVIPPTTAVSWRKALEATALWKAAGFDEPPVEPIYTVEQATEKFHLDAQSASALSRLLASFTKPGREAVLAGVLLGPSLEEVLLTQAPSPALHKMELTAARIDQVLQQMGIDHGHANAGNFVVSPVSGSQVWIIDFDQARQVKSSLLQRLWSRIRPSHR